MVIINLSALVGFQLTLPVFPIFRWLSDRGSCFQFLHHSEYFDSIIKMNDYDNKKLIMMQKLKARTAGQNPMKIVHVEIWTGLMSNRCEI